MATLGSYDIQLRDVGWFDAFLYSPAWFDEDTEFGFIPPPTVFFAVADPIISGRLNAAPSTSGRVSATQGVGGRLTGTPDVNR